MSNAATATSIEDLLARWSEPPSNSEDTKCENARRVISNILNNSSAMRSLEYSVFAQGSYRNNTNVRLDSDVDLCACCESSVMYQYNKIPGLSHESLGIGPAPFSHSDFKDAVESALSVLGTDVSRGNKAFDIKSNTFRVTADVVPCLSYVEYFYDSNGNVQRRVGTYIRTDDGKEIVNWPQHHYDNGVAKNRATSMRFKPLVRTLKNLRNSMVEDGCNSAKPVSSFLIESLVWNLSLNIFEATTHTERVRLALREIVNATASDSYLYLWLEVNGIKRLFTYVQPWTYQQVNQFCVDALKYLGVDRQ